MRIFSLSLAVIGALSLHSAQAQQTSIEIIPNTPKSATSLALSADGKLLLAGTSVGARLWDMSSGRLVRIFSGHANDVTSVVFVAGGAQFLSSSKDRTVKLWETATGKLLRTTTLQISPGELWDSKLSPDGSSVLVAPGNAPADTSVKLFDTATGRLIRSFPANQRSGAIAVAFSADGSRALSAGSGALGGGGKVKLWDVASGRLLKSFEGGHAQFSAAYLVAFSPDGSRIVSGDRDQKIFIWDTSSGRILHTLQLPAEGGWPKVATFSTDGTKLIVGHYSKRARVYEVATGRLLQSMDFASSRIVSALFLPNSSQAIVSDDFSFALVDVIRGVRVKTFGRQQQLPTAGLFTPDGSKVISASKSLAIWDARSGQLDSTAAHADGYVMALSADGTRAVSKTPDNSLELWNATTQQNISTMRGHTEFINGVTISPDGMIVLSCASDKTARLWDAATGRLLRTFTLTEGVETCDLSPDGTSIATGDKDGMLRSYALASGKQLWSAKVAKLIVFSIKFSPDGRTLIVGTTEPAPLLVDAATGRILRKYEGHAGFVYGGISFSPDGKTFLTASFDKTVKLWDVASGRAQYSLQIDSAVLKEFSRDGRRILLNNDIIDAQTGATIATLIASSGDQPEWIVMTPEGFFNASPHGADTLSVVRGVEVYAIDQFYQALYRPDLVREKLAGDPRGLVRQAAAQLDLGKVIGSGGAPDVRISLPGRSLGSGTIDATQVRAEAEITDRGGGIGRVEWRVNGITAGIDTPSAQTASPMRLFRSLALDPGDNAIEVVAYNGANLIASVPARMNLIAQAVSPSTVPATPSAAPAPSAPVAAAKPRLFVLAAGVNEYAEKRIKLSYAVSDASEIARGLKEAGGNLYTSVDVKLMRDADVTAEKLDAAFAEMAGKTTPSDMFVLYLAGHGKTVDGRYYFIPQDFAIEGDFNDKALSAAVKARGIAQEQWQKWFASVPARRSVILFDTCDSGTLAGDETQELERGAASDRLAQATGRSILAASAGTQEAIEGYRGHGLFTYNVLDAIYRSDGDNSGTVELNELAAYVYGQVSELSQKIFKQRQVPQMRLTGNYPLAKPTRIIPDEAIPVAEGKPAYQVAQTAQLQVQPSSGATVVRSLSANTRLTVLENRNGWSLVASPDGKPLGYVASRDLAPVH